MAERLFRLSVASAAAAFLAWLSMGFTPSSDAATIAVVAVQGLACLVAVVSSWVWLKRFPVSEGWRHKAALIVFGGSAAWLLFMLSITAALQLIGDD
jgi:hypothetical protein